MVSLGFIHIPVTWKSYAQIILLEVVILLLWTLDGDIIIFRAATAFVEAEAIQEIARRSAKRLEISILQIGCLIMTNNNKLMLVAGWSRSWILFALYIALPLMLALMGYRRCCPSSVAMIGTLGINAILAIL